ncbi:MAG: hypothetical protein ABH890_02805 [Bacillota bacterium]
MQIDQFKDLYERNNIPSEKFDYAVHLLEMFQDILGSTSIDLTSIDQLDQFIERLLRNDSINVDMMIVFMRYFRMIKRNDLFIHLTKYTGGLGVIESILERLEKIVGKEKSEIITRQVQIPLLGTHPSVIPQFTQSFIDLLEESLDPEILKEILAGNHHQIPESAFLDEHIYYENAETLDQYLKELHDRKVQVLQKHLIDGTVWFEQNITEEVVEFVKSNQEILSAVRKNDQLYVTKIPYDTKAYLNAKDPVEKAYHACHCPFAKESIGKKDIKISGTWCNCSAGFAKFPFDILFGKELKINVLENAIKGDLLCRFSISLEGIAYKK